MDRRAALLNKLIPELRRCETALANLSACIQRVLSESSEESAPIRCLPPEIWHEICTHLDPPDLSNVRLTCRTLNAIVSTSARLMEHYPVNITQKTIDSHRDWIHALGTTSSRFRTVFLEDIKIVNPGVGYWFVSIWENAGGPIRYLNISQCNVPSTIIIRILACMPELREFHLYLAPESSSDGLEPLNLNLALHNLRIFTIWVRNVTQMPLLQTIQTSCINLERLELTAENDCRASEYEQAVLGFVKANHGLEEFSFNATNPLLLKMSEIPALGFKEVTIDEGSTEIIEPNIVSFVEKISTIAKLDLSNIVIKDFATLVEIGKSLPNLTWISLDVCSPTPTHEDFSFLYHMPRLEYLRLFEHGPNLLWFKTSCYCSSPKLTELCLVKVYLPRNVLLEYLLRSPGIDSVNLSRCTLEYASDVIFFITRLKSLKTFNLCEPSFTVSDTVDVFRLDGFSSVQSLELSFLQQQNELAVLILNLCPALVSLRLAEWIDDDIIREVCQSLKHLKSLDLSNCHITRTGFRYLREFHGNTITLEKLVVVLRPTQATEKEDIERLLKQMRNVSVHVICYES